MTWIASSPLLRSAPWMLALVLLSGCVSHEQPPPSGFLHSYEGFVQAPFAEGIYVKGNPRLSLGDYKTFLIDPVLIAYHVSAYDEEVPEEKIDQIATEFRNQAIQAIADKYEIVDKAGPGVLRIRAALTDLVPSKPLLNAYWLTKLTGLGLGGAAMEAEFIDSVSGEVVVAVIAASKGNPFDWLGGMVQWKYTRDVLNSWARLLRSRLDYYHGREDWEKVLCGSELRIHYSQNCGY